VSATIRTLPGVDLSITFEEYRAATENNPEHDRIIQFAKAYCGLKKSVDIVQPPVLHTIDSSVEGTVHHVIREPKELAVVTSFKFPEWLRRYGLERAGALEFAALYVASYGLVASGLLGSSRAGKRRPVFEGTHQRELWVAPYDTGAMALPYRNAASLALCVAGIEPFIPESFGPHSPQVASLANPLSNQQARSLLSGIQ
jgi:hypothetical protein